MYRSAIVVFFLASVSIALAVEHTSDSLDRVRELLETKKAILIDVREQVEWDAGHIAGAKLVPMSKLRKPISDKELQEIFPRDKIVYLYCAGGYRCLDVAEQFEDKKLPLKALKQGYQTLLKAGFPKAEEKSTSASVLTPSVSAKE